MNMEEKFAERLTQLRIEKGVSARDMSLSIGQNSGYINNIENKNNLPSMASFFYICEYLDIAPNEFFEFNNINPKKLREIIFYLKRLDETQLAHLTAIVKDMIK